MDDEVSTYTLNQPELELMATGSQPVDEQLRTYDYSVLVQVRIRLNLFSNPANTTNTDHVTGDYDIDHALAQVAQLEFDKLGQINRSMIEVDRIVTREVVG